MKPKTLEEALAVIEQLTAQVADITAKRDQILQEKKDLMQFTEEEKEKMTDNEKRLLSALEGEKQARIDFENKVKAEAEQRNKAENERVSRSIEERISRVAKGDSAVADKLRANVALLEKMPRGSEAEIDAIVNGAYNMLGTGNMNPLAQVTTTTSNDTNTKDKPSFGETEQGKKLAGALGLDFAAPPAKKEGEGEQK